jgi:hypothetical protein
LSFLFGSQSDVDHGCFLWKSGGDFQGQTAAGLTLSIFYLLFSCSPFLISSFLIAFS